MNYYKHYNLLIERSKNRDINCYVEKHHIIPKCLGGTNDNSNLVNLTPEEHYLAHLLLIKIYPNESKLIYAARMMTIDGRDTKRNNKIYGWLKRKFSKLQCEKMTGKIGWHHTDESKQKISESHKGKKKPGSRPTVSISNKTRKIIRNPLTDEQKKNISEGRKGKTAWNKGLVMPKITCPYCNKSGSEFNMNRWHFENCKKKELIGL